MNVVGSGVGVVGCSVIGEEVVESVDVECSCIGDGVRVGVLLCEAVGDNGGGIGVAVEDVWVRGGELVVVNGNDGGIDI